jgi:hypothetical protein
MQEQNVKITVTAEDRASGPIKNVESALGGLEKGTSKAGGAMYSLGHAAEVAVGTMATAITTYGIAAVQNLNREMVKLSLEQSKFQSQTGNLLKNAGIQSYSKQVETVIGQHSELTSMDDISIRKSFNNLISVTKDYERSLKLLSAAEDYASAQGIDLESATKQVAMALSGSTSTLEQNGVVLDLVSMKSMTAAQKMDYLAKQMEKSFGGSAEALRNSTAGIFANFQNQAQNLKALFGDELTGAIAPALENIADKISEMINSGEIQPLVDAFGNLLEHSISFGSELGNIILKLAGVTSSEEAITKLADAFDRVSYILGIIEDALSRINVIIKDLHLDKIIDLGLRVTNPGGMALWDYAGQQVQYEKAGAYTPYEAAARGRWISPGVVSPNTLPGESESAADALGRLREIQRTENENKEKKQDNSLAVQNNTQNVLSATELLKLYKDQTSKTGAEVDTLGKTAGSAISYMNSAMNTVRQMLTPSGGGGGGGCRTFSSGSYTSDGHSESYTSGDGSSRSSGMAWYNVLGNENASAVAAMGSSWAASVNTSSIVRNSCSGQVCSFEAGGQKFYGDGGGSYSSVNDALIKKDGGIVNFHPDDNILAFKDGSKFQGKNVTINNTFNISGNGDPDKIADEILKRINRITRVGF